MKVVSFNIRNVWAGDGINSFMHRIGLIYQKINAENPDVIGFQEIMPVHYDILVKLFPDYEFFGSGRKKDLSSEGLYTAYKKDSFTAVKQEIFWLSDTPSVPESRFTHQSTCPRICVVTKLYHKASGNFITFYNAHLDHITIKDIPQEENARAKGLDCILNHVKNSDNTGVIILGDFNASPNEYCISLMENAKMCDVTKNLDVTFHGYGDPNRFMKIDYIFLSPDLALKATPASVWDDTINGIYLSDHYPVVTDIDI